MVVGFGSSFSINSSDEMLGCESLPLIRVCSIEDRVLRICDIVCEEESSRDCVRPIRNRRLRCRHVFIEVSQAYFNLSCYNSSDQWLRLKRFKMNRHPIRICRVLDNMQSKHKIYDY